MKLTYEKRINQVLIYINQHLDENPTVAELSKVACFSPFHFHRIFRALMAMPLGKYIQYLKLRRAAYQLVFGKDISVTHISLQAGFESLEGFSRAFKKQFGLSPLQFRKSPLWDKWPINTYQSERNTEMNIEIKSFNPVRVACVKHRGTPQNVNNSAMKLLDWARENNHALKNGGAYGIAYDDPETTVPEKFRFDLCLDVGRAAIKGQDISEEIITGGKYAVLRHKGSHDLLGKKLMAMFKEWLPTSSEELRDAPCFFHYQNYVTDVAESELITDICIPIL